MWDKIKGWVKGFWDARKKVLISTLKVLVDTTLRPMIVDKIKEGKDKISSEEIANKICEEIKGLLGKI